MKKLLLPVILLTPLFFIAQNIKKEKVKSSYLSYPMVNASTFDVTTAKADYCLGDLKFLGKKTNKSSVACKNNLTKKIVGIDAPYYQFSIIEPVGYTKISDGSGNLIAIEKTTAGNKGILDYGKGECANSTEDRLAANYAKDKAKFESKSKSDYTKGGMKDASEYLNRALFFTYIPQDIEVYYVKNKDGGYDDLEKAAEIAKGGFEDIKDNAESKDARARLTQAAAIWEKAMAESAPDNKDARINKKVTLHVAQNLATAYLYLMEFDKAKDVIQKALDLEKNITTDGTRERQALQANIIQNSKGYAVNQNTKINMQTAKVAITTHPSSEIGAFEADYKKHGYNAAVQDMKAANAEYEEKVAAGEINPYQKYVVPATTGTQLRLPDLAAKLANQPGGEKLDEFPEEITELTEVEVLILSGNNIKTVPSSIGKMTNLKRLNLSNNQLKTLPDEIGDLKELKALIIKGNNIPASVVSKIQGMLPDCKIKQ